MNSNEQQGFVFNYSSEEQREIKKIREKYTPPTEVEDKMTRLRKLDASVTVTAQAVALTLGIIGALILGFGMSLIMTDLSVALKMSAGLAMALGIVIGLIGGILASIAYPMYNLIVKIKREKIAPEIIRLTDELMK